MITIILISITAIAFLLFSVYNIHKKKTAKEFVSSIPVTNNSYVPQIIMHTFNVSCRTAEEVLSDLISDDKSESYRTQRNYNSEYENFDAYRTSIKENQNMPSLQLKYLWDATLKLSESGCRLVAHPEYDNKAEEINNLVILHDIIRSQRDNSENGNTPAHYNLSIIADILSFNKRNLAEQIREYSEEMVYSDFEDGNLKYTYLSFLYSLHCFIMSLDNLIKQYKSVLPI